MAGQDFKKSEILNNQTFLENQLYHVARTPYLIYITDIENKIEFGKPDRQRERPNVWACDTISLHVYKKSLSPEQHFLALIFVVLTNNIWRQQTSEAQTSLGSN